MSEVSNKAPNGEDPRLGPDFGIYSSIEPNGTPLSLRVSTCGADCGRSASDPPNIVNNCERLEPQTIQFLHNGSTSSGGLAKQRAPRST